MRSRVETGLANLTLGFVVLYVPVETWASWYDGPLSLTNPFYIVDFIGMVLLLWGALHSRRARPRSAPAVLAAAWAWSSANFWRATFARVEDVRAGGQLDFGEVEMCVVACSTALALVCMVIALVLTARPHSGAPIVTV